jgi:anaerobic magnesium-protoporphyrin IX monomethyl ester cyclase
VPFVQANLIATDRDDPDAVKRWRSVLRPQGVRANELVPLFPYPGLPNYRRLWGLPDDYAGECAADYYLDRHAAFSDIQEAPLRLAELEAASR